MLGRFLEISLASADILSSLAFYRALGFRELLTTDSHPYPYAVISDGRACIGLHNRTADAPVLSFVATGLAETLAAGPPTGFDPIYTRLDDDDFNEAAFADADGHTLTFLEARTFSPPAFDTDSVSLLGYFEGIALPSVDLESAAARWEGLGFVAFGDAAPSATTASDSLLLASDSLNIYLHRRPQAREPAAIFSGPDLEARIALLKQREFEFEQEIPGANGARLRTPEGLAICLVAETPSND